jgi:Mor family transcriptional regulator
MRSSSEFIKALVDAMPTPQARLMCLSVLARWAGTSIYLPMESKTQRRRRAAAHMLDSAMSNAEVAEALRERFGISARTAWRDVEKAKCHSS